MAGWSHVKRVRFERAFRAFLSACHIDSKDKGFISLGDNLYEAQERFISLVLDGLERDIHKFFVLKSRQLGLSTISRAFSVFYLGAHPGLKGALVFDSATNKEEARAELLKMIEDLPASIRFPPIKQDNRDGLTLVTNSRILFKHAGVRKQKMAGTLGRSIGLSFCHMSEICSFDSSIEEGLISFERSLSDSHPDRLYIYESTARGYNMWKRMWDDARRDTVHCATLFVGWWTHYGHRIERDSSEWELYGTAPLSAEEKEKTEIVKEEYGYDITQEQWAWYRRSVDPTARDQGDVNAGFEAGIYQLQEEPTTETDAFQQPGAVFFVSKKLKEMTDAHVNDKFEGYMYACGVEFEHTQVMVAPNTRMLELKVWEPPHADATYVLGIDPAFGENENNDRSSVQVFRCWADGLDQVAEYNSPLVATHQLAWVIASLLGWYSSAQNTDVRYILELNGPGMAVFNELKSLKRRVENIHRSPTVDEKALANIFRNVKTYIYSRPDSIGGGHNYHFKTTSQLKITLMERLRDFIHSGILHVRSMEAIEEMKAVKREGDSISAPATQYDDRVVAMALGCYYWDTRIRLNLLGQNRTREADAARERASIVDQVGLYSKNMLTAFFGDKRQVRIMQQRAAMRAQWRGR